MITFFSMFSISLEEQMQLIAVEVFIHLSVYLYLIIKLFVCVKRQGMSRNIYIPAYSFNIFGSIFGVLFWLLMKIRAASNID